MRILIYQTLTPSDIPGFERFSRAIEQDDFRAADARKIDTNLYRARLGRRARLLFSLYRYRQEIYCLAPVPTSTSFAVIATVWQYGCTTLSSQICPLMIRG